MDHSPTPARAQLALHDSNARAAADRGIGDGGAWALALRWTTPDCACDCSSALGKHVPGEWPSDCNHSASVPAAEPNRVAVDLRNPFWESPGTSASEALIAMITLDKSRGKPELQPRIQAYLVIYFQVRFLHKRKHGCTFAFLAIESYRG